MDIIKLKYNLIVKNNNKVVNEINGAGATAADQLIKCFHCLAIKTGVKRSYEADTIKNTCTFYFKWSSEQSGGLGVYEYYYNFYGVEGLR
jgi:hypothetical protein